MPSRRRFLLVSYFYPPHGGAGVQRALALSRLAPALGWDPVVLASSEPGSTPVDRSLLAKIPPGARVERTPAVLTDRVVRTLGRLRVRTLARALPVDRYLGWLPFAWTALRRIVREERIDLVFSTSGPYTAHLVGGRAKKMLGVPWIADFRDPWTDNEFLPVYKEEDAIARARRRVDGALERRIYDAADLVTVTAAPYAKLLVERHGLPEAKVRLVRNGFDRDDFPDATGDARPRDRFRLLFAGSMYGEYNLAALFRSAERLLERRDVPELELSLLTATPEWARREAPKYPRLHSRVRFLDAVPHDRVVEAYRSADVLVLASLDALSVPGKLYEYIAAGPPVLAFVAPGTDTETLLAETGAGTSAPADDPEAGALAIERAYERWREGAAPERRDEAIEQLTRQRQVEELVGAFEELSRG